MGRRDLDLVMGDYILSSDQRAYSAMQLIRYSKEAT